MQMPVPSSYNDITTSSDLRDYVGPVWYERTFFVPSAWSDLKVFLRFGSVNYHALVASIEPNTFCFVFLTSKVTEQQ